MPFGHWHGRVDADLCGDHAALRRWIDASAAQPGHQNKIFIALNAGGNRPLDVLGIFHVDIVVHDDGVLDVGHAGEQEVQNLFRIRIVAFLQREDDVSSAARGAERQIFDGESFLAQHLDDLCFAGRAAKHGDFLGRWVKHLENRVVAMRDRGNFDHVALIAEIISRGFAEGTFGLPDIGQDSAFDDDLGMGRDIDIRGLALGERERTAEQAAGHGHFIFGRRANDGREQQNRMDSQANRDR